MFKKYNNKIVAVVKFNDGEALVLKNKPKLLGTKYGSDTIIMSDGLFYDFFYYEASRKKWWDGITERAWEEIIKGKNDKFFVVWASAIDDLKRCYVFTSYYMLLSEYTKFRKTYKNKVFQYYEYEEILKQIGDGGQNVQKI